MAQDTLTSAAQALVKKARRAVTSEVQSLSIRADVTDPEPAQIEVEITRIGDQELVAEIKITPTDGEGTESFRAPVDWADPPSAPTA